MRAAAELGVLGVAQVVLAQGADLERGRRRGAEAAAAAAAHLQKVTAIHGSQLFPVRQQDAGKVTQMDKIAKFNLTPTQITCNKKFVSESSISEVQNGVRVRAYP